MIDRDLLTQKFEDVYGCKPALLASAPGRVNLIGEHTDYNGGFVLPAALDRETVVAISPREDRKICARSLNINEKGEIDLDAPEKKLTGTWMDYVEGVARVLEARGYCLRGADMLILSDVPTGSGLSSSAALEVSTALALSEISGNLIDRKEIALISQQAEHEYVGAKVGIMDQFVAAMGKPGLALLIDCRELTSTQVKLIDDIAIVVCDTNVKHNLASSEYNVRRQQCEEAVERLSKFLPGISLLRDVSSEDFFKYAHELPDVIMRRARHIITDSERTPKAAEAMTNGNLAAFGELMRLSHISMRDDYEISCAELDVMVEIADATGLAHGSRMTGGGFGGSTVSIVPRENAREFVEKVLPEYNARTGLQGTAYVIGA